MDDQSSATGARWSLASPEKHNVDGLIEATKMPLPVAQMLASRGLLKENIERWLDPKMRDLMPNPSVFADMDKAAGRLADAVVAGEAVGIFGDYDVDGAVSATIFQETLTALGLQVSVHIPHRSNEGYGPNLPAMIKLIEGGHRLILTVDCGVNAHAPIEGAVKAGAEVIVVDHHLPGVDLPPAMAVVNPNRHDDKSGHGYLAAAGVSFMVAVALLRELRQRGHFSSPADEPVLENLLDCVALATIADVVPLVGLNRAFIRGGLQVMTKGERPGLKALAEAAQLKSAPNSGSLGFVFAPRINAGGRLGAPDLGVRLLTAQNDAEACKVAAIIERLNTERRAIEKSVTDDAHAQLVAKSDPDEKLRVLCSWGENWDEGVIGISAGKLKEHFNRAVCVISVSTDEEGRRIGKGSGRSIAGFKLGTAIAAAKEQGLLITGGGHDMAAGFSLDMENYDSFVSFISERAEKDLTGQDLRKTLKIDAELSLALATSETLNWLDQAEPYGVNFTEPLFVVSAAAVRFRRMLGKNDEHIAVSLDDFSGKIDGIGFFIGDKPLGKALKKASLDEVRVDVVGSLGRDRMKGKPQLIIKDLRPTRQNDA